MILNCFLNLLYTCINLFFRAERIKYKKSRRYLNSPAFGLSTNHQEDEHLENFNAEIEEQDNSEIGSVAQVRAKSY